MKLPHLTRTTISIALLVGGFSAASIAPAVGDDSGSTLCPNTITGGIYIAGCLPSVNPPADRVNLRGPDQLATIYGIPCTGADCIGLSRLPGGAV